WKATDQAGNTSTVSFDVIVTSENDLPTIHSIPDILVTENTSSVEIELTGISYGIDCVEEDVMVSAEVTSGMELIALDSVMYTAGADSGMLMLSITPEMSGMAEVMVTVVDEAGDTTTTSFMVTVTPVNDAPFLVNPFADQTVNASYELAIAVSDVPGEYFDDPDGDMLTLTAMVEGGAALPVWAEVVGDTLHVAPMIADTGCYTMVVEASDPDGLTATDTFQVCVEGYPTAIDDIGAGEFEVNLYPNPTRGMVNVDIESSTARDIELTVLDITGKQVLRKQFRAAERITFDMSGKVSGMYFVKLDFEGQQVLKKLVVDRK
ncbi:MAG TPA: T9SS type A sorting domain-containing protein, partial [Tangfeifania sp.]|nr:T9SS type A sorting domain-containing protein [Tangfeifania sp.]